MKVYIIRHGESASNALSRHEGREGRLSPSGVKQARAVAHRLSGLGIGVVYASDHERAQQTAAIVVSAIGKRVVTLKDLGEWRPPSEILGVRYDAPAADRIWKTRRAHFDDPKWHYSDEENMAEFLRRAGRVVSFLERRSKGSVLVVAHGYLIKALVGQMLFRGRLTHQELIRLHRFLEISNTGITEAEHTAKKGWKLLKWNDTSHLHS